MAEEVDLILRLSELQTFVAGMHEAGDAVGELGVKSKVAADESKAAGKKSAGAVGLIGRSADESAAKVGGLRSTLGGLKGIVLGALAFGGISGIKKMITDANEMRTSALAIHQVTGMSTADAAAWAISTQAYGVSSRGMSIAMKSVAMQAQAQIAGTSKTKSVYDYLGISAKQLTADHGNMNKVFDQTIDRFNAMPAGVNKTAIASKLFGRNWQTLMPLLTQGSGAINSVTKMMGEFGLKATGSADAAEKFHQAQAKMKEMWMVIQMVIAQKVVPVLTTAIGWIMNKFVPAVISVSTTIFAFLKPAFAWIGTTINGTVIPALKDAWTWIKAVFSPPPAPTHKVTRAEWTPYGGSQIGTVVKTPKEDSSITIARKGLVILKAALGGVVTGVKFLVAHLTILTSVIRWQIGAVETIIGWLIKHKDAAIALGVFIGLLVTAFAAWKIGILAVEAANTILTAGMALLNAVMDANPIALIIIALAALTAGVVYCWLHFQTFREVVTAVFTAVVGAVTSAFNWVKGAVTDVISFISDHWKLILAILTGPFGLIVDFVASHFDTIVGFVSSLPGRIAAAAVGLWDSLKSGLIDVCNWIIGKLNMLIRLADRIPGVSINTIPLIIDQNAAAPAGTKGSPLAALQAAGGFAPASSSTSKSVVAATATLTTNTGHGAVGATGAIVTRPTMARIGEAGPEALIPLSRTPGSSALPAIEPLRRPEHMPQIHTHVIVDGKEVARAVGGYVSGRNARR